MAHQALAGQQQHRGIASLGLPAQYIWDFIEKRQAEMKAKSRPIDRLAVTCALEHFTAILAEASLTSPELVEGFDPRVRAMWIWHAIEETEHKSVAYDVFEHVGGDYRTRVVAMLFVTREFILNQIHFHRKLMEADGESRNVKSKARGFLKYWGPRGVFTKLALAYLEYFRRDFHPWQHDNRELVTKWKRFCSCCSRPCGAAAPSRLPTR